MQNPPNQQDPDQDLRKESGMEDSKSIEFLRARLLSERSVSKIARQRADELAKRVLELEEELKIVSLQRKKAEKAAIDVLSILENNGISEFSEEFDSTSDHDMIHCESKACQNSPEEESSVDSKMRRNHADELSGSELESSPLPGRSLSWKSGKDFSCSREKKYKDSPIGRRSSSVSTTSTSPRRRGKSCRQIRRRETRSAAEESQSDHNMLAPQRNGVSTFSDGLPGLSDTGTEILRECTEQDANSFLGGPGSGDLENQRMVANSSNYLNARGSGKDMERALAHQAQLIGQYEEEEKAQREWEEKFRENNSSTPDSCEPGNHSDVTEERDETKDDAPSDHVGTTASQDQEAKSKVENIRVTEESSKSQLNGFQSPPQVNLRCFQDQRSQPSDFEFPVATANQNMQSSAGNHSVSLSHSYHHHSHSEGPAGNQSPNTVPSESALIPHETPDTLESVLEALHQAKLSLKHKAYNTLPLMDSASVGKAIEYSVGDRRPEVPVGCPGLFRVPSDFQFEAIVKSNFPSSNSRLSLTNHYPDSGNALSAVDHSNSRLSLTNHYPDSGNALSAVDHFTTPFTVSRSSISTGNINLSRTNLYTESRSRIPDPPETWSRFRYSDPSPQPSFGTDLPLSRRYAYTDPNMDAAALVSSSSSFVSPLYPYPNLMPQFRSDEGRRLFSSMGARITPSNQFFSSDGIIRPNYTSSSAFSSPAYPFPDVMPRIPSEERSRLFSSSGAGIPPQNHFALENDHLRRNAYR